MHTTPSTEEAYARDLGRSPWQLSATIRLPRGTTGAAAHKLITAELVRPLARITRSRVAGVGFLIKRPYPHGHVLLLSDRIDLSALDSSTPGGRDIVRTLQSSGKVRLGLRRPGQLILKPYADRGSIMYDLSTRNYQSGADDSEILIFDKRALDKMQDKPAQPLEPMFFGGAAAPAAA